MKDLPLRLKLSGTQSPWCCSRKHVSCQTISVQGTITIGIRTTYSLLFFGCFQLFFILIRYQCCIFSNNSSRRSYESLTPSSVPNWSSPPKVVLALSLAGEPDSLKKGMVRFRKNWDIIYMNPCSRFERTFGFPGIDAPSNGPRSKNLHAETMCREPSKLCATGNWIKDLFQKRTT